MRKRPPVTEALQRGRRERAAARSSQRPPHERAVHRFSLSASTCFIRLRASPSSRQLFSFTPRPGEQRTALSFRATHAPPRNKRFIRSAEAID